MICITEITIIIIIFILFIIFFLLFNNKQSQHLEYDKKMILLNELIETTEQNINKMKKKTSDELNDLSFNRSVNGLVNGSINGSVNGLAVNGLPVNGLPVNGLAVNNLPVNGLQDNGFPGNGFPGNGFQGNGLPVNGLGNGLPVNGLVNGLPGNGLVNGLPGNGLVNGFPENGIFNNNIQINRIIDPVDLRDRRVLDDPLYPPLGRTDRPNFDFLNIAKQRGLFDFSTRGSPDTFRIIGYMMNKDENKDIGNNIWKIFGRQKYPNSSMGEYYVIPANENKTDIKIKIKDDMIIGEKMRDIYNLPKYIKFKSSIFNKSTYEIIELDKSDLISQYI
jgi:hypothetical protein